MVGRQLRSVRRVVPKGTVRTRLTVVYGTLFLASGAVLLTITGLLWGRATRNLRIVPVRWVPAQIFRIVTAGNSTTVRLKVDSPAGATTALQHAAQLAKAGGHTSTPVGPTPALARALAAQVRLVQGVQQNSDLHQLLLYGGIALGVMAVIALLLGWLISGRVLRPLRTITATANDISASNLHERLALGGPDDELRRLGDTIDELLGRLEASFEAQRQFVANASHELRTPLATMRASVDVALGKPEPIPEQTRTLASRIGRELDGVDRLLDGFLALARAQRGPVPAGELERVALDELADRALVHREEEIARKRIEVRHVRADGADVEGNGVLLARMVENVVDNAVRHHGSGGWIEVRTALEGEWASITVENDGPVLDARVVAGLVRPFRRLAADRTGAADGFGLGLSIVASVVEAHGGTLALVAPDPGGFRVEIRLPAAVVGAFA